MGRTILGPDVMNFKNYHISFVKKGVTWGLQAPFPTAFLSDLTKAPKLAEEVRQVAEDVLANRNMTEAQMEAYMGPVEGDWAPSIKIGYPTQLEYINDVENVSHLDRARLGITAAICCSIQHALYSVCGLLVKQRDSIDIFALLQDPGRAAIYAFGSLKQFYETFLKYRSESHGYSGALCRLSLPCGSGYSEKIARSFFSPDDPMQKFVTLFLQLSCANGSLPTGPPFKPLEGQHPFKWGKSDPLKAEFKQRDPQFYKKK